MFQAEIEAQYHASGNHFGWRFLSSPASTLTSAHIAFVGLNPGGNTRPNDHAEYSMPAGISAYRYESWDGQPIGKSKLQKQVLCLFDLLGAEPHSVLSGNLVPFRSPRWDRLCGKAECLEFGKALWQRVFDRHQPQIVIGMGGVTNAALADILRVPTLEKIPVGWGGVSAVKGEFEGGRFVGLPHLSRFTIMNRPASEDALKQLFVL